MPVATTPEYLAECINILCERGERIIRIDTEVTTGVWGEPEITYICHSSKDTHANPFQKTLEKRLNQESLKSKLWQSLFQWLKKQSKKLVKPL